MAQVNILNPLVYGKIKLLKPIIHPDTQAVMHDADSELSWDDFVQMLALGIEKIDIQVVQGE